MAFQVNEYLRDLPANVTEQWQKDMNLAMKGIVEPKKAPQKPEKPQMSLADDLLDVGGPGLDGGSGSMGFSADWERDS